MFPGSIDAAGERSNLLALL